jgi:hypothetical protein
MDGRGRCRDNAKMERFWWALKYEDIKIKDYVSLPQLRFGVQHCSTKLRMKFILALVIRETKVILKQSRLHRSFRKSCPAKGLSAVTSKVLRGF